MARLLLDLQPLWDWRLAVGHCDHQWRRDSSDNALHVANLAQSWKLPYFVTVAEAGSISTEAAARAWRYARLEEMAGRGGFTHIATGHTASDRAETLLYNLMRGSGADGLQALAWRRRLEGGVMLVRPLLQLTRSETAAFCAQVRAAGGIPMTLCSLKKLCELFDDRCLEIDGH